MYTLYRHVNKTNGKIYVGITGRRPNQRWKNGLGYMDKDKDGNYRQPHFANAIEKYGWDGFTHEILATGLTEEQANIAEQLTISYYKSTDPRFGYNHAKGGMVNSGWHQTPEANEKNRQAHLGKPGIKGWHHTEEARQAMSKAATGRKQSPETVEKRASKSRGKKHNQEWCDNISKGQKGKPKMGHPQSEETKQKLSNAHKGIKHSEEAKKKMSESKKGKIVNNKKVKQISTGLIFDSGKDASLYLGHGEKYISQRIARGDKDWIYLEEKDV